MKVKSDIKGRNQEVILGGSMSRAIAMLAIPTMVNSLLQTAYNLTDTYWLGHVGSEELAAINLVTPVQNIITNFGSGITVAGSVLIAQYIGARARDKAKKMAEQIYVSAVLFAVICAALCFILTPAIVSWLGAEGNVFSHAKTYLQIVILDMPLLFTINVFTAVNQAQGDTLRPMRLNFLGTALNMVLDPLFMAVFKWGTAGAALATMLAKLPPALIALVLLMRPGDGISISFKGFRFDTGELKKILTVGLPSAMGSSAMWFGFLLMSKNVFVYGTNAMAAYGIGNKCNSVITLPVNGIGSAVATIVGQNMGAGQVERAQKGYVMSRNFGMIFLFVAGMILSRPLISNAIVRIFTEDEQVAAMAADFLAVMAFWCWTNSIYNCTIGLFQGSGYTNVNMLVEASRLWVFRFLSLFICEHYLHMGVRSVWYCVVISNGASSIILYILYKMGFWKRSRIRVGK